MQKALFGQAWPFGDVFQSQAWGDTVKDAQLLQYLYQARKALEGKLDLEAFRMMCLTRRKASPRKIG